MNAKHAAELQRVAIDLILRVDDELHDDDLADALSLLYDVLQYLIRLGGE